ncbi:phosphatase PAP2 family protein [Candidatus Woesearchaeota archaeon]|nr:phosphatase PAP2 family protein [Candidatus Woesearchaeota archaeon]
MAQKKRLHLLFSFISLAGTPFFYVPAALLIAFFSRTEAVRLAALLLVVEALCGILKFVCPKKRPIPLPCKTIYQRYNAGSFPSIHTARIAAMSVLLASAYTGSAAVAAGIFSTIAVGYSRVYLQKHYVTDVLAGAFIGAALGVLFR